MVLSAFGTAISDEMAQEAKKERTKSATSKRHSSSQPTSREPLIIDVPEFVVKEASKNEPSKARIKEFCKKLKAVKNPATLNELLFFFGDELGHDYVTSEYKRVHPEETEEKEAIFVNSDEEKKKGEALPPKKARTQLEIETEINDNLDRECAQASAR
jgi:hypothetical protein